MAKKTLSCGPYLHGHWGTPETASSSSMFKPTRARFSSRQAHYLENTRDKPSLSPKDDFYVYVVFMHGFAWFYFTKEKKRGLGGFKSYIGPLSFSRPSCVCKAPGPGFFLFFFCLFFCLFNILLSFRSKKKKWTKLYEKQKHSYYLTLYDPILPTCKSKPKLLPIYKLSSSSPTYR